MEEAILHFHEQFDFKPEIINGDKIKDHSHHILAGMGGSHLASGLLKLYKPGIDLYVHRSYGLPPYDESFLKDSLLIASSYSGNTEETLDFLEEGYAKGYNMAAIATGGKILEFAQKSNLPYIQMPDDGIQPRAAIGYSLLSMAKFTCDNACTTELSAMKDTLKPEAFKERGEELAKTLDGKIPLIYTSNDNLWLAYNWKIKMNETAKIPAFYGVFPEFNHNELTGFDFNDNSKALSEKFHAIIIRDIDSDHPRVQKRMAIVGDMLEEKGIPVTTLSLEGQTTFEQIFNSMLLADWIAVTIAKNNGADSEAIPMVEGLKEKMAGEYPDTFSDTSPWS